MSLLWDKPAALAKPTPCPFPPPTDAACSSDKAFDLFLGTYQAKYPKATAMPLGAVAAGVRNRKPGGAGPSVCWNASGGDSVVRFRNALWRLIP
jgi:hypothetical protein